MISLLVLPASPLNAPGLLTARGWDVLRSASAVASSVQHAAWAAHLREAGVESVRLDARGAEVLAQSLIAWVKEASDAGLATVGPQPLVWLADAEHPYLPHPSATVRVLEAEFGEGIEVDYVFASPVAPGSAVVESVRIMHELRSPGGDPWSAEQTHASLARYLLEETHEVLEELERPEIDTTELVGEFGDLLFQLVFHARIGTESHEPWDLDSVARALNMKMYRRNPHVFSAEREELSVEAIIARWESIKSKEKTRSSVFEGIPRELPALQRAFKIASRIEHRGDAERLRRAIEACGDATARELMTTIVAAVDIDHDPESALRRFLLELEATLAAQ